jgi:hypothetical protein
MTPGIEMDGHLRKGYAARPKNTYYPAAQQQRGRLANSQTTPTQQTVSMAPIQPVPALQQVHCARCAQSFFLGVPPLSHHAAHLLLMTEQLD